MMTKLQKPFDAVSWVREVRDTMYEEQKNWTQVQRLAYLNSALEQCSTVVVKSANKNEVHDEVWHKVTV